MAKYNLKIPLQDRDIEKVRIGDLVYFSGKAFTCRSRLQKYIFDEKHILPFSTKDKNLLIHVGPIIRKKENRWKLISFMPTSSIRFEKWGPKSVKEWGLKAIIGKTTMGEASTQAMKENKCIHVSPVCVSPNLWLDSIKVEDVFLLDELGSIEASWQLEINNLGPFLVDIDCHGNNYFDSLDIKIQQKKMKVYHDLGIPDDFEYTKLY
jgi:tartrate/fumarate subfamily iron-sulfur-dependent hydro-lyase beta chain